MKASQITTRDKTTISVTRSLAVLTMLTFFAAAHANACCPEQVMIESRILEVQRRDLQDLGVYHDGRLAGIRPDVQQPVFNHRAGDTTIPINNDLRQRRKEEELKLRQQVIDGLKQAGVIREPDEPAEAMPDNTSNTTQTTQSDNNNTKTETPAPKPKEPKVTKLPNGDQVTEFPDGRREVKLKNGDTVTTHPNGLRVIRNARGDTTETHPSGYRKTTDRYGDGTARFPDGTRIDFKSSGEATLTTPDGRTFHRDPGKAFKEVD
ncbi:MAG: T-complex 10 C-terminal domain-containing protein [Phycisphaerales bacterium]